MAIFDFIRNRGKKILGKQSDSGSSSGKSSGSAGDRQQQQRSSSAGERQQQSAGGPTGQQQSSGGSQGVQGRNDQASANAIREHILSQDNIDAPEDIVVLFDADDGVVIIEGTVPDEDTAEAIVIVAGDIEGVGQVDDRMNVEGQAERSAQPKSEALQQTRSGSSGQTSR
jgi:osmotically-inducible protein OsmY